MLDGRGVHGPNNTLITLQLEDITMFKHIIEQVEDMFRELKKTNPRWVSEIKAHESRPVGYNNNNNGSSSNGGSVNGIPAGPKRDREDDDDREREKERLDRELDRDRNDRREAWGPRQQQFNRSRNGQFNRQRSFADQGYGSRLDSPNHENKRRR